MTINYISSIFFLGLVACSLSLKIDKCWTNKQRVFADENLKHAYLDGYVNADLDFQKINDIALVSDITFIGHVKFEDEPTTDIVVKFDTLKKIRVQRIIDYDNSNSTEVIHTNCNLDFVIDYDKRMGMSYLVENQILLHTEKCVREALCSFDSESHRLGDDMVVKSRTRNELWHTTSQETVNQATDFLLNKLINGLIKANKSIIQIPNIDADLYAATFKSSGGPVDILRYIERVEDFSFLYEGHRYIVGTTVHLTGGNIQLNDVQFSSVFTKIKGTLPVNMTETKLRMKVALDYNTKPCKISVDDISLKAPADAPDFSQLKSFGLISISIDRLLGMIHGKSMFVNFLAGQVEKLLKNLIEGLSCEEYRELLFGTV